jgi:proteasome lid subunit RPN8/RPN11
MLRHDRLPRRRSGEGVPGDEHGGEIDSADLYRIQMAIDDDGLDLGAIYHSHPRSEPVPSQTDINLAFYPDAEYIIVGLKGAEADVRSFTITREGKVTEAELVVG